MNLITLLVYMITPKNGKWCKIIVSNTEGVSNTTPSMGVTKSSPVDCAQEAFCQNYVTNTHYQCNSKHLRYKVLAITMLIVA